MQRKRDDNTGLQWLRYLSMCSTLGTVISLRTGEKERPLNLSASNEPNELAGSWSSMFVTRATVSGRRATIRSQAQQPRIAKVRYDGLARSRSRLVAFYPLPHVVSCKLNWCR